VALRCVVGTTQLPIGCYAASRKRHWRACFKLYLRMSVLNCHAPNVYLAQNLTKRQSLALYTGI